VDDPILTAFELAAERAGDITADIYRRYYARCPEAASVMSHADPYMQGRMMEEVLNLMMSDPADLPEGYLTFETANHASYGVVLGMYPDLLESVRDAVRDAAGADWSDACAAAWDARLAALIERIRAAAPPAPDAAAS
jgi:hypothetical protein